MTVHEIRLDNGAWKYDDSQRLGPIGGFGAVFVGWDECDPNERVPNAKRASYATESLQERFGLARNR